jgi:EAL domain-containing protein (putative c-di-GMP-specific phosphodiesterase class I)
MRNPRRALKLLARLCEMSIKIAIDDVAPGTRRWPR